MGGGFYRKILIGLALGISGVEMLGQGSSKMKMTVCDVGQGEGVVFSEGSNQLVYDFGPENNMMVRCLEEVMGLDRVIEAAVISHNDSDHIGGMAAVEKGYTIEQKYSSENIGKNDIIGLGKMQFVIRWPEEITGESNKDSVVMEARLGNKKILLMGDVTKEEEQKMAWREQLDEVDVLVAAHHGSGTATSEELLRAIEPETVIISVGKNNFGHPSEEVIKRLKENEIEIRRTDQEGMIVIEE